MKSRQRSQRRQPARRFLDVAGSQRSADEIAHGNFYVPLDEWLQKPRTRILRSIRWFDWVGAEDLFNALGLPFESDDEHVRRAYSTALRRLVNEGLVERRGVHGEHTYRLKSGVRVEPPNDTTVCEA